MTSSDHVDIGAYLAGLDHQSLVELVLDRAGEDELFDARLRMAAARATAGAPPPQVYRDALDDAFDFDGHVSYQEMYGYVTGINSVLDSIQELLDDGHADEVIALVEYAVDLAEEVVGYADDSDGYLSGVADRLRVLHLTACEEAEPDSVMLARTLFDRQRRVSDLEVFFGAVTTYADLLGEEGVDEFRRLVRAEWDALAPLSADEARQPWSSERFGITKMMEELAILSADVDALVEVLAHDQSSPYQFVRIAQALLDADRYDDALEWAMRGLEAHGYADSRLVEVVAGEHHRAGRGDQAVQVLWDAYVASPRLDTYRRLSEHAQRADVWPEWHDRALDLLRKRTAPQRRSTRGGSGRTSWPAPEPNNSTLVEVLLHDGDVDQAWAEASTGDCHGRLMVELAELRETDHPDDAIPIWQSQVESHIAAMNTRSYGDAVTTIERVAGLMKRAGRPTDFEPYVASIRAAHKPKRNLMKLFAERGW